MTEVEKLYSLAGFVKKQCKDYSCIVCEQYNDCEKYPPFTAEKQIELIEFMLKKYGEETIGFELWKDNSYHVMCHLGYDGFENYADANTLGGAIAGLITLYWKDFTEAEQNEIRRILE